MLSCIVFPGTVDIRRKVLRTMCAGCGLQYSFELIREA